MKKIVLFAFLLTFLSQCTTDDKKITDKRVGNLKIGSGMSRVLSKLEMYNVKELQNISIPGLYKYYNIYDNNKLIFSLMFFQDKLWAIQVHDNTYYTSKGVRIGNTAQEVINKGHKIWAIVTQTKNSLRAQTELDDVFFYFQKRVTKSGQIGKYARLQRITIGQLFDIYSELEIANKKSENLSITNDGTFYSKKFDLELFLPNNWTNKTKESKIPSVTELLFIKDDNKEISLLVIAQKLSSKFSNGYDYLTKNKKHFPTLSNVSSNPVLIANQEFYSGVMKAEINGRTQIQLHYCTINNDYAVIITGKYFVKENEGRIRELIGKIKAHNK